MLASLGLLCLLSLCGAYPHQLPSTTRLQPSSSHARKLHGRFLHITDIHPDPFYKTHSSTEGESACHRGAGPAGYYGAETSDCDTPVSLMNATFKWIEENLKDSIDFVVWTGDSARHDNDEQIPRSTQQIVSQNELVAGKFFEVFRKPDSDDDDDPTNDMIIPIVPTFGNNDVLPHNIFEKGPNRWTLKYLDIWRRFIPEEQRHQFQRGGWFYVEVIPGKLAVFSLNTLYFFDSNSAVDGCAGKKEPGYEQFEWLRVQLQFLRERGMKAFLIGHVPPARTENKMSWDETCWQKYTLWTRQYRDVIAGQLFGHMNINHFMFQDFNDIDKDISRGIAEQSPSGKTSTTWDDDFSIASATDYLIDLRNEWAKLPSVSASENQPGLLGNDAEEESSSAWGPISQIFKGKKGKKGKKPPSYDEIGGRWAERYSLTHVGSSVVPNYFPTLRVFEYNTTGLEALLETTTPGTKGRLLPNQVPLFSPKETDEGLTHSTVDGNGQDGQAEGQDKKEASKRKKHKFVVPAPPSKSTPPGPAYSPQTLALVGYTHYFANLTYINNDFTETNEEAGEQRWKEGKHKGKDPKHEHGKPHPNEFKFEVEYSTFEDRIFRLKDLTVMSYLDLARRIGENSVSKRAEEHDTKESSDLYDEGKKKKKKDRKDKDDKDKKSKGKKKKTKEWFTFVRRAFVETVDPETIEAGFGSIDDVYEL